MRIISRSSIRKFSAVVAAAAEPLNRWFEVTANAEWKSLVDIRRQFAHCDPVVVESGNRVYVFNIGGGNWRLIAAIHFNTGVVYVLRIMTHAEYDKNKWKKEL